MKQKLSAIFFLLIFTALISAPAVVMAIDNSIDISCLYSINEEEENKVNKESKLFYYNSLKISEYINGLNPYKQIAYCFKAYQKPNLNLIFPPPEFIS